MLGGGRGAEPRLTPARHTEARPLLREGAGLCYPREGGAIPAKSSSRSWAQSGREMAHRMAHRTTTAPRDAGAFGELNWYFGGG